MILLDTHVWVWWMSDPGHLSSRAKSVLNKAMDNEPVLVSSISVWEIALLVKKDRLRFTIDVKDWIAKAERVPFVRFVPVDNAIAFASVSLPDPLHDDPADRIIVATALQVDAAIVTKDKRILQYPHVKTIW